MSANQRQSARKFREYWLLAKDSEVGGCQKFWMSLLGDVLGAENPMKRIDFQLPVPMAGTTKFLDAWIPETRVLIEHKSRGVKLDAPQTGHGNKTPFQQALEYNQARGFSEKARWIVTCNFDEIWVYDMDQPLSEPQKIRLADLPKEISRLGFLVDATVKSVREKEKDISIKAGRIVGELYKVLLKRYEVKENFLAALNRLCVRLVFCFYAEDAEIFPKDCFWKFLNETPAKFLRDRLIKLFRTLDTPEDRRDPYLEPELAAFPYTNGGLFHGVLDAEIPPLDDEIRELLVKSSDFDWRGISPTIFGALFESTLNPETRRSGGMVYTSVENIHKVVDPLFLDDLTRRVDEATKRTEETKATISAKSRSSLLSLQSLLASLAFLDPACGSGNFLTETYICLRRLENRIIAALQGGQGELDLDVRRQDGGNRVRVSIAQFYGIEINDFAVAVAKTALWIAEAQMLRETAEILHREPDYLPLKDYANIVEGNALRMDWREILAQRRKDAERAEGGPRFVAATFDYIMGNPPFVGARNKSSEQAADMEAIFGREWKGLGNLDYVTAWYKKAVDCMVGASVPLAPRQPETRCAFVSTNSICQGGGVAALWKPLFERGLEIDFAHRTFRWDNESFEKAHVHCVIVGFHVGDQGTKGTEETKVTEATEEDKGIRSSLLSLQSLSSLHAPKLVFDNGRAIPASHINGYLMDAPDAWIESERKALYADLPLVFGSMPNDGGFLSDWSDGQRSEVLKKYPAAEPLFRRIVGSHESINATSRWCLWLKGVSPAAIRAVPPVMDAVAKVREMRQASKREATRKLAATPTLFGEIRQPESGSYLLIPSVSSERREYIPMAFLPADVIANNLCLIVPNATLYHFGVLTSSAHMAWMRVVAGRLESRYRYSAAIVYNNFPWPETGKGTKATEATEGKRDKETAAAISNTAQSILDARARYPDSSLADLYDPLTMPTDLRAAHTANDRAVLAAYGLAPDAPESEIVEKLFELYAEAVKATKGTEGTKATREKEASRSLKSLQSLTSLEGETNG